MSLWGKESFASILQNVKPLKFIERPDKRADLGGYVRMSQHVTLLVFQKTFSINILKQKTNYE